jgi:hypothetical protein
MREEVLNIEMNRRKFLKISTITSGATTIGGGTIYTMFKNSDPLSPFFEATQKVFTSRFDADLSATLVIETKQAYEAFRSETPYIGGKGNMFTEWLNYSA